MLKRLNNKLLLSLFITLSIIKVSMAFSASVPESERFEWFQDPANPSIVRVPIVRHFPSAEEMKTAKEDYTAGELKLLGRPVWTIWGTITEVDIDIPEGLRLLRRAAYYGHPKACSLLSRCFRWGLHGAPENVTFADALSASSGKSESLWEQSERFLKKGEEIPTKTLILPEIWGPIERARKDIAEAEARRKEAEEKRIADATAAAAAEDVHLEHLESKRPEEDDDAAAAGGETDPLLGRGSTGLRRRPHRD
jgi:TPR repeat protein